MIKNLITSAQTESAMIKISKLNSMIELAMQLILNLQHGKLIELATRALRISI